MLTGGCLCGAIRYEADGTPFHETNCHRSICRRTAGAAYLTWFSVRSTEFQIVKGQPARLDSTEKGSRSFCSRCGTQLTFQHADFGDEIDVTTSSLDAPDCSLHATRPIRAAGSVGSWQMGTPNAPNTAKAERTAESGMAVDAGRKSSDDKP